MKNNYAKFLEYRGEIYTYSHSKGNVLIYIIQPHYYYDDWQEDGAILVVKYKPNTKNNDKYYVLHNLKINEGNGYIDHINLTKQNRIAKEYER
jgi:hypothetical protein